MPGVKIGGNMYNNLRYADDTALIAASKEDLKDLIDVVYKVSKMWGLELNAKKTVFMVISKNHVGEEASLIVNSELEIKTVNRFKYLGSVISENGRVDARIGLTKSAFKKIKPILTNRNINIKLKQRLIKCYLWSVLLYGCES